MGDFKLEPKFSRFFELSLSFISLLSLFNKVFNLFTNILFISLFDICLKLATLFFNIDILSKFVLNVDLSLLL